MQAIVLAAGAGTRLREAAAVKPLALVAGKPLLAHVICGLAEAGVGEAVVVVGYESDQVRRALGEIEFGCAIRFVENPDWRAPNGVSVLAAAPHISGRALLTMSDHLADSALYARVSEAGEGDQTVLGIDRRLGHPWVDEEDVTRVRTHGEQIVAIGKLMPVHDCYDTGVFSIGQPLFQALAASAKPSLSDGMQALSAQGLASVVDVSGLDWLDVDDPRALAIAEEWLGKPKVTLPL